MWHLGCTTAACLAELGNVVVGFDRDLETVARLAGERLEVQHRQVLADLRREVGQLAIDLAGRIVGESLGDKELQRRVVDRFLAELEESGQQPEQVR
jgi:F-type H+-transporting ATPase subunit b